MRSSLLAETLKSRATAHMQGKLKRSTYIVGSPGLGKTQITAQVAKDMGAGFMQLHAPLMQPEDYGMPVVNAARDGVDFVVPTKKFPVVGSDCPDTGILLIDEMPQADNSGQKILANLMQEREIHGKKLKDGWHIVATGNKSTDRAGANRVLSHLSDRLTMYELEPHLDDWCSWALSHGVDPGVVSFIRFKPGLLSDFDPQRDKNPTPRGWVDGVSAAIGTVPTEAEFATFAGDVGEGPASEFTAFLKILRKLPNPDAVLMHPDKAEVPTDPSTLYAISGAIAHRASPDNFERVMTYGKRLPPEFTVLVVRDALNRNKDIHQTRAFIDWATNEGSKVLL